MARPTNLREYLLWVEKFSTLLMYLDELVHLEPEPWCVEEFFETLFELHMHLDEAPINKALTGSHPVHRFINAVFYWAQESRTPYSLLSQIERMLWRHPTLNLNRVDRMRRKPKKALK